MKRRGSAGAAVAVALLQGSCGDSTPIAGPALPDCGYSSTASEVNASGVCGAGDPDLPPEPSLPADVCQTIVANKTTPDESALDSRAIRAALGACKGQGAVKLVADGAKNVFVSGNLIVDSTILWIDKGVTLYMSRDAKQFQKDGNCGLTGISDSNACIPLLSVTGTSPGVVGDGVIDGQGGEPLVGHDYSWWDLANALRSTNGSGPNPAILEVKSATRFLMYRITLNNSPKAHVKLSSNPARGTCDKPGEGFIVWGVTILTPSRRTNRRGYPLTPYYARNTDGFDPGEFALTACGLFACNTISTGDDQIAIKGAHGVQNFVIAHNHFGSGHGMSIGSETNGGVSHVIVYDLTIDGSTRWSGAPASDTGDFNGLRVKSDESRGGLVDDIQFHDVCTRDVVNAIVIDSSYNPLFAGALFPHFGTMSVRDFHAVSCKSLLPQVVDLQGFSAAYPAGPITLDNVVVDGITPVDLAAQFSSVTLGPGPVNFVPAGPNVKISNVISGGAPPRTCRFPALPLPR